MVNITTNNFNLKQITKSGQCFRMSELEDGVFEIIAGDKYLKAYQNEGSSLIDFDISQEEFDSFWSHYFDIETDYSAIIAKVDPQDSYLNKAVNYGEGIRILNQDLWEMMVSFLISQQNNITRIRKCIDNISRKYGKKCINKYNQEYYAFPTAAELALDDEDALMECNLGYRSKYVVRLANMVNHGEIDLNIYIGKNYDEAKAALLKIYGIGNKVADCICLFALHHVEAFPIDTHIKQVLENHYADGFPFERYEGVAGIIQQYMFYYDL